MDPAGAPWSCSIACLVLLLVLHKYRSTRIAYREAYPDCLHEAEPTLTETRKPVQAFGGGTGGEYGLKQVCINYCRKHDKNCEPKGTYTQHHHGAGLLFHKLATSAAGLFIHNLTKVGVRRISLALSDTPWWYS